MSAYTFLRQVLFAFSPETAHRLALIGLRYGLVKKLFKSCAVAPAPPDSPWQLMGIPLANPIGLAAGLDKNGDYLNALAALGFGFIEVGTVTPKPQAGNSKPRLFRLPEDQALINRMGFNNRGVDVLIANIKRAQFNGVLGINIGKNAATPIEDAVTDYLTAFRKVYPFASYVTLNISSPNTKNLRSLQDEKHLYPLLKTLKDEQKKLAEQYSKYVPIAVKIAPDLTSEEITLIAATLVDLQIDGVICTNTALDKSSITSPLAREAGGLSGAPIFRQANTVLELMARELKGKIPIIGTGGITRAKDALTKLEKGATAVQIYTGLIYAGPELITEAVALCAEAEQDGKFPNINKTH